VQLPPGATLERTQAVMQQVEGFMLKQPEVQNMVAVLGFSFSGQGQNAGLVCDPQGLVRAHGPEHTAEAMAGRALGALSGMRDAFIFALSPPPIPELGSSGFTFRLQDRGGNGHDALLAARNQMLGMASKSKVLAGVRPDGLEDAPQLQVDIDRDKASALGVGFDAINNAISTALGSAYVNDFPNAGRLQRVVVQADAAGAHAARGPAALTALNSQGKAVPLSAFATTRWITGAMQTVRYNGYPAMRISGGAAPGFSTGDAMAEMERWPRSCRRASALNGPASRAKKSWPARRPWCCTALPSWRCSCAWPRCTKAGRFPLSVILVVPLGVLGVLLATLRGMPTTCTSRWG
jgi:multidrug efflux pump